MAKRAGTLDIDITLHSTAHAATLAVGNGQLQGEIPQHRLPKIRIIHIDAPKVVRTDVANFRTIVQQLTGKSSLDSRSTSQGSPSHGQFIAGKCHELRALMRNITNYTTSTFQQPKRICIKRERAELYSADHAHAQHDFCVRYDERHRSLEDGSLFVQCDTTQKFSEQDIIAGLVSGEPLPDITMLPPLVEEIAQETVESLGNVATPVWKGLQSMRFILAANIYDGNIYRRPTISHI